MRIKFKYILLFILFVCSVAIGQAQSTLDKLILEDAKTAYANNNHKLCLEKIDELEKRGQKGLIILHLKIMATSKTNALFLSYEQVAQFKKDVAYYLKNYDNEDFMQQYKEVYEVSKTLSDKKYDEGELAHRKASKYFNDDKDYKNAFEWHIKAHQYGVKNEQFIGYMYAQGLGVEKDVNKAIEWFTKAAEQGNPNAQYNLGVIYSTEKGVEIDYKKAIEWYTKAAAQGYVFAQTDLGRLYAGGVGVETDVNKAIEWFTKAAEQGNPYAQYNLGVIYRTGKGVEIDYKKAIEWYTKAAAQGYVSAQTNLGRLYATGEGVETDVNKAIEWFTKAAEQGDPNAQYNLGVIYKNGQGVESDNKKAFEWYTKAAAQGNINAQTDLGRLYATGEGVEKDLDKAIELFKKAVEGGYKNSFYLAYAYETKGNYTEAYKYYQQHNETGKIGYYFYEGKTINQDYGKAVEYWEISAQKATAYNLPLAVSYFSGKGIPKDTDKAFSLILDVLEKYKDQDILKKYMKEDGAHHKKHFPHYAQDEATFFEYLAKEHNIIFEE